MNKLMSLPIDHDRFHGIARRSRQTNSCEGFIKRLIQENRWVQSYYILYQNLLFEYDNETNSKVLGVFPLEHCYAYRLMPNGLRNIEAQQMFYVSERTMSISHTKDDLLFQAIDEKDCCRWVESINESSYSRLKSLKEEYEHRNLHLLNAIESERLTKWQLQEHTKEQRQQLDSLRKEIPSLVSKKVEEALQLKCNGETEEMKSIRKVQSFLRGVLCRRRWHAIVQEYIHSPHGEQMRARNRIVFQLVRSEEEYLDCLSTLVSGYYRPCKMAASSKTPPISHDDVNSIFLNCETLMFLHQIFLKGLQTRMESWPKLLLGDLFDMLLPMLSIYQEYVRNHHYSLQTLTDCKQLESFRHLLHVIEEKPSDVGRTLETYLTFPMYRIPTYIVTLQKLLSLTPFDHVERKSLEHSQSVLEELSTVIHEEVSETENIRKNLAIERLFVDGCDFLLDSSEIFLRQGILLQVNESLKLTRKKSAEKKKDVLRHCFLFSRVLLIASRTANGKLQIANKGRIDLSRAVLFEDIIDEDIDLVSLSSSAEYRNLAFKLTLQDEQERNEKVILMAPTMDEKISWTSDIAQCTENLRVPHEEHDISIESRKSYLSIRSDARLFTDSDDIKYSRALDSCRLPKIRYASVERLLERLLDVRFLSIEYLNTFLLTFNVFTTSQVLLDAIIEFYHARRLKKKSPPVIENHRSDDIKWSSSPDGLDTYKDLSISSTAHSPASSWSSYSSVFGLNHHYLTPAFPNVRRHSSPPVLAESINNFLDDDNKPLSPDVIKRSFNACRATFSNACNGKNVLKNHANTTFEALSQQIILTSPPKNRMEIKINKAMNKSKCNSQKSNSKASTTVSRNNSDANMKKFKNLHRASLPSDNIQSCAKDHQDINDTDLYPPTDLSLNNEQTFFSDEFQRRSPKSPLKTPPTPGVVITSYRESQRRSSIAKAAVAFAAATAGGTYSPVASPSSTSRFRFKFNFRFNKENDGDNVTHRVLKILKHWLFKRPETIKKDRQLTKQIEQFTSTILQADDVIDSDMKAANTILKNLLNDPKNTKLELLQPSLSTLSPTRCVLDVPPLQIAEQLTLIDHLLISQVPTSEFLSTSWMKEDKIERAPHLLTAINRFNLTSRLVAHDIVSKPTAASRASVIEKWTLIADSCRCLHNFNSLLAIITAFTSSAVFRLRKTWEKVSKQSKSMIDKLKTIVCTDGRFKNMREAMKSCDPPCIPYLGIYLTDLAFIEERTSLVKDTGLVNFAKMRMVANVIEEIKSYQIVEYKIKANDKLMSYLLEEENIPCEEKIYQSSLEIEHRRHASSGGRLKFSLHF